MNVTVYGDSILKGVLYENGRYVLERGWEERLAERFGLRVVNRSRFGNTLPKALARIESNHWSNHFQAGIISMASPLISMTSSWS